MKVFLRSVYKMMFHNMLICHELDAEGTTLIMGVHRLAVNVEAFLTRVYLLTISFSFEKCISKK